MDGLQEVKEIGVKKDKGCENRKKRTGELTRSQDREDENLGEKG